ncbi:MAG: VCBS repeat-containing protein [Planctomycetes bacterium]|nr:VCBS repeat-containing protein [Planctomycetota bacterium]
MDGDGVRDLYYATGWDTHFIRSGADGSMIQRYIAPQPGIVSLSHGWSADALGDWNGDGIEDYVVGTLGHSETLWAQGIVRVFSGADHSVVYSLLGNWAGQDLGEYVCSLGDVDGDGFADFAVQGHGPLVGFMILGGPLGHVVRAHPYDSACGPGRPAAFSDLDGDGKDEYLVGCAWTNTNGEHSGSIDVRSGSDGHVMLTLHGQRPHEQVGWFHGRAGDWNGDGVEDVVVGASGTGPDFDTDWPQQGAYVMSGTDGGVLFFVDGNDYTPPWPGSFFFPAAFGAAVASERDLTGDGVLDLVVGAPHATQGTGYGNALVFSGATGSLLWRVSGEHNGGSLSPEAGSQVETLDDVNGDGIGEWVVVESYYTPPGYQTWMIQPGRIRIFYGAPAEATPLCPGAVNSTGAGARLWNSGPIALAANELVLDVEGLPPGAPGVLVYGSDGPPRTFGAGTLCLQGPHLRFVAAATADSAGELALPVDLFAAPFPQGPGALQPGDTGTFQFLYRDGAGRNASNALRILFPE